MEGKIFASCGHEVGDVSDWHELALKDYDPNTGLPCIIYGVYCDNCTHIYMECDEVLYTSEEEEAWLNDA